MPLPPPLQPLVRTRRFWTDFLWETYSPDDAYPELASCTITLPVAGGYELSLSLDTALSYFSLQFASPGNEAVEIAWDDLAHPYPQVLRWQELELLCRAVAVQDAALPHPGMLLLLLYRFAPICIGDDLDIIVPMLESAWRQLGAFSRLEIAALIERADARSAGFRWRYNEALGGWCLEQDGPPTLGFYTLRNAVDSLRDAPDPEFPFGPWAQMLIETQRILADANGAGGHSVDAFVETGELALVPDIVRSLRAEGRRSLADALGEAPPLARVCRIVETLRGMEMGSLLKRYVPRNYTPREQHYLRLLLPGSAHLN